MSVQAKDAISFAYEHDYAMGFSVSVYLLRDLYRIIEEKPEDEQFGIAFAAEDFAHLWDKTWSNEGMVATYTHQYRNVYPKTVFYWWNGQEVEQQIDRDTFFQKVRETFLKEGQE